MKRVLFLVFLQSLSYALSAQFVDDFSGEELAEAWLGDRASFQITDGRLQLNNPAASGTTTSALYALAATASQATTTWRFDLQNDFSPSASNFTRIYLATDRPPGAADDFTGYYLQVGGISGNDDALTLYRQDGSGSQRLLLSGTTGAVSENPQVSIQVERSPSGVWTLEADYNGGEDYEPQGSVTDATYPTGQFFGLSCTYTTTRNDAFYFDNIEITPIIVDETPPTLLSIAAEGPASLSLQFNEAVELAAATFAVAPDIGTATAVRPVQGDASRWLLDFGTTFTNLTEYTLSLTSVDDLSGNRRASQELTFTYLLPELPQVGDLILTEIFPDPTPPVGLPDFEYVELWNSSSKVLQLEGLGLSTGGSPRGVDAAVLLPGEYITLCDRDAANSFASYGKVATLASFPALTNGGDDLILTNAAGVILLNLRYAASWYQDDLRADGGYALELIDPARPQDCPANWRASQSPAGGTPGQVNSVNGQPLENAPPQVNSVLASSATEILVRFDEKLSDEVDLTSFFTLSDGIGIGAALLENEGQSVRLFLESPLAEGQLYVLDILPGISDCLGNQQEEARSLEVGLAVAPQPGMIVLNEILFNPFTGGVDFVELYNPTTQVIDLTGLRLRNEIITSGTIGTTVEGEVVILPGDYLVFTSEPANILANYDVPSPNRLVENRLPSLADDEGNLSIYSPTFVLLDSLTYREDWHNRLLRDRNGVSLERLRVDSPTQDAGNWSSAASVAGFATPTGPNSQSRAVASSGEDRFFVLPEKTLSPDGDGFQDVLEIRYTTDQVGYTGQLLIFDEQGRLIRQLNDLDLLAGSGSFLWDGTTDSGSRARMGIYILFAEIFTPEGDVVREKHAFVLAGRLD